jgi:hypothetical protein
MCRPCLSYKTGRLGWYCGQVLSLSVLAYFRLIFAMLQLRSLALLQVLAALAGSVSAFDQSTTTLEIVNKNIQPDGYPRP